MERPTGRTTLTAATEARDVSADERTAHESEKMGLMPRDWKPPLDEPMCGLPAFVGLVLYLAMINAAAFGLSAFLYDRPVVGVFLVVTALILLALLLLWRRSRPATRELAPDERP